jgi:ATP-dependent DNA ligase
VCVFVFDILFFEGKSLLDIPLKERRKILRENFMEKKYYFEFATSDETSKVEICNKRKIKDSNNTESLKKEELEDILSLSRNSSYSSSPIFADIKKKVLPSEELIEERLMNFLEESVESRCEGLVGFLK